MTYRDQETRSFYRTEKVKDDRFIWVALILLFLALYLPFALEAKARQEVCISAATIDSSGTVTSTPVLCI